MKKSIAIPIIILLTVVAVGVFFYTRSARFDKYNTFYGYYTDARGLQKANFVTTHGVRIGKISKVEITPDQHVKVTFAIQKATNVPAGTIAIIASDGLTGERSVNLLLGNGPALADRTILHTGLDTTFVESFNSRVTPLLRTGKVLMHTADSTLGEVNYVISSGWGDKTEKDIQRTRVNSENLVKTSAGLNRNMATIDTTIRQLNNALANPASKNADMNRSITKADKSMQDASQKDMRQNMRELRDNVNALTLNIRKAGDNKAFKDKTAYQSATQEIDTFGRSIQEYYQDPPPFRLLGSDKKK